MNDYDYDFTGNDEFWWQMQEEEYWQREREADLELQAAPYQDEWNEYESLRTKEMRA